MPNEFVLKLLAKAETSWRFWGLYVHVCKMETLREAYVLAKNNDGAPGVDGVTFAAIEAQGVALFLEPAQRLGPADSGSRNASSKVLTHDFVLVSVSDYSI